MPFRDKPRKRRSDRLMFTIPLRVEGFTEKGEAFECSGHATGVNRHGAQILLEKLVDLSRQVRVTNLNNGATGDFRVVGILPSSSPGQLEFGAEALGDDPAFWGIGFPPRPKKPMESRGLLECRRCHTARFLPLSISEVEVLESGGLVLKPCEACHAETSWGYAFQAPDAEERGDRHAFVQRPISIRTCSGQIDNTQTESLSRIGLSCSSDKAYKVNQEVTLEWVNPGTGLRVQAEGRILHRHSIGGSRRKIYSIRYESPPTALPPTHPQETLGRYAVFSLLVASAALLLETSAQELASGIDVPGSSFHRLAFFAGVLLLVCLAQRVWKSILAREPEGSQTSKWKHQIAVGLAGALLIGGLAVGATRGLHRNYERGRVQTLLRDLVIARTLERNIDAAENRVLAAPGDYMDACATLQLLATRWEIQLGLVSTDASKLSGIQWRSNEPLRTALGKLQTILGLDRRKLELVQKQAGLAEQARRLPEGAQPPFWQANFQPLRQQIIDLNAREGRLLRSQL